MRSWPSFLVAAAVLAASPALAQSAQAVAETEARVQQLHKRAEALKAALAGDVCANRTEAVALLKAGATLAAEASPPPAPAEETDQPHDAKADQPPQGEAEAISRKDLAARLHKAVVLVIADKDTGSGFFVTPDTVVTNNHVISSAKGPEVMVVGRGLDGPKRARVIARTNAQGQNERDYAILKVEGVIVDATLPLELETSELTNVVAAGFPGLLLNTDMNFRALIRGDMKAMPELAMSQGAVMAVQNRDRGLPVIAHSAPISGGNSGGPLVDMCGRTVGINTFINVAVQQASSAGFAQSSKDLAAYLRSNGIEPEIAAAPCNAK
jgi:S1-C subfamily serine protease